MNEKYNEREEFCLENTYEDSEYDYRYENIAHYVSNEYSVCREERQYALFLSNILKKSKTKDFANMILKSCGFEPETTKIIDVFYEATFMRDFLRRDIRLAYIADLQDKLLHTSGNEGNRRNPYTYGKVTYENRFNYKLLEYVSRKIVGDGTVEVFMKQLVQTDMDLDGNYKLLDLDLGAKTGKKRLDDIIQELVKKHIIKSEQGERIETIVNVMMKVKPDIAVIYKTDNMYWLRFLECKFESKESTYSMGIRQTEAQDWIVDFLCNKIGIFYPENQTDDLDTSDSNTSDSNTSDENAQGAVKTRNRKIVTNEHIDNVILVEFIRRKMDSGKNNQILIQDLIRLNKEIFG